MCICIYVCLSFCLYVSIIHKMLLSCWSNSNLELLQTFVNRISDGTAQTWKILNRACNTTNERTLQLRQVEQKEDVLIRNHDRFYSTRTWQRRHYNIRNETHLQIYTSIIHRLLRLPDLRSWHNTCKRQSKGKSLESLYYSTKPLCIVIATTTRWRRSQHGICK
jgi:hypothetical protein